MEQKGEVSRKLIRTLGLVEDKKNKDLLQSVILDEKYSQALRLEATKAMGRGWSGEDRLLNLAKTKQLPADLQDSTALILANSGRGTMREEAAKYLKTATPLVVNAIAPVDKLLMLHGNKTSGAAVFAAYCAVCHQVNNAGINFGPNLSEIGTKLSKEALYTAILHPSEGISFGYEGYLFKLKDGSQLLGYIASQTEDEITIKMVGGQSQKLKKSEIQERRDYGKSLMTEGLPQGMGQDKFVDLLEYLATLKKKN
jgi:putative heme-binding domain-containing protein